MGQCVQQTQWLVCSSESTGIDLTPPGHQLQQFTLVHALQQSADCTATPMCTATVHLEESVSSGLHRSVNESWHQENICASISQVHGNNKLKVGLQAKNKLLLREAISFYDQGLKLRCKDAEINAALCNNRAHVNSLLGEQDGPAPRELLIMDTALSSINIIHVILRSNTTMLIK